MVSAIDTLAGFSRITNGHITFGVFRVNSWIVTLARPRENNPRIQTKHHEAFV